MCYMLQPAQNRVIAALRQMHKSENSSLQSWRPCFSVTSYCNEFGFVVMGVADYSLRLFILRHSELR